MKSFDMYFDKNILLKKRKKKKEYIFHFNFSKYIFRLLLAYILFSFLFEDNTCLIYWKMQKKKKL